MTKYKKRGIIISEKGENDRQGQKGGKMEMTNIEFKAFIKLIIELLENSTTIEEAKEKIKALIEND